ncbi:MAG: histidinol dehydrogenase [Christensenellales bacterium]|jgi:histidinol dehydrogenase
MIKIISANDLGERELEKILGRSGDDGGVEQAARSIVDDVRQNGDAALVKYTKKFDWPDIAGAESLRVSGEEIDEGAAGCTKEYMDMLSRAAENIRAFHEKQLRSGFMIAEKPGVVLGQRITPLDSAGLYVPGGTASYPSTVLMDAIPAKIAGVERVVLATPPGGDGKIPAQVLAAAKIAGVTQIYKMGGAQAIAALAYGTRTVKAVDKIVGPGNAYVAAAKRLVFGRVGIDMIAGPSEILIIADAESSGENVAADMLSQAEHDAMASAILVTDCSDLAQKVAKELERQMAELPRSEICRASIENHGLIIIAESLEQAAEISNRIAPEHLELFMDDPFAFLPLIKHAGSIFMGRHTPEALGDYFAGPNHTLPTSGTARFSSPLSVDDFIKKSSYIYYDKKALENVGGDVAAFAESEGLKAHGRSVEIRLERNRT